MTQQQRALPWRFTTTLAPAFFVLAGWRLRQSWRWVVVMGLGVLAAAVIVCAVPLFAQVALTAGARSVLTASPQDSELELQVDAKALSSQVAADADAQFRRFAQASFGSYLSDSSQFVLQMPGLNFAIPGQEKNTLAMTGVSIDQARSHLRLLQGRLPFLLSSDLEVVLTQPTATDLQVSVGSIIPLQFAFYAELAPGLNPRSVTLQLPLHVVGIVALDESDPFWHAVNFEPMRTDFASSYRVILSSDTFISTITQLAQTHGGTLAGFDAPPALLWYFFLDASRLSISNLDDLIAHLDNAQLHLSRQALPAALQQPQLLSPAMDSFGAPGSLERFRDRIPVVLIPLVVLTFQIFALILYFISVVVSLSIDRQAEAIALLRSRGASRRLVFQAFILPLLPLLLLALMVGPVSALLLIRALGHQMLASSDQSALAAVNGDPLSVVPGLLGYALLAVAGVIMTLILSVWIATRSDIVVTRRDLARSTRRALWQRLRLDMVAAVIAVGGFGVAFFMTHSSLLDARTNQVVFLPVSLAVPLFLLLALVLFFVRFFPLLLRFFARQTRRAGAPLMLALAQMSRAPYQSMRMLLLLALSISFALFTMVFSATETQYTNNVAAQQVGADFSGPIPIPLGSHPEANVVEHAYQTIPGVISATVGGVADGVAQASGQESAVQIRAVDTKTFAQTAIWTDQDSSQPIAALLAHLPDVSQGTATAPVVPALVDGVAWNLLHLAPDARFTLNISGGDVNVTFQAVAEVQHIPTINDSLQTSGGNDYVTPGGILVDLTTYTQVFQQLSEANTQVDSAELPSAVNYIWLRTSDGASALATVRAALTSGPLSLETLYDRRAMIAQMQRDPLYLTLKGVLLLGAATTVLLALLGGLLSSWLHARSRLLGFAVLRALGSTPRQIAGVLSWELGIVYSIALVLGGVFGALLVVLVVPVLVFTNPTLPSTAITSTEFFVIQQVLPVQIVLPQTLGIALVVLVALAAFGLVLTTWMVAKPALSQTLRLDED
ncbi:MAG TPA: FtsX-like permease family protein [Ktedonobacterales bacterium]|nr:FtsX-like permease family protein [Ktedonobacterales bacterium]